MYWRFFLEQYVVEPTRDLAILDLILCNEMGLINDHVVKDPLGTSDHCMLEFQIQFEGNELEFHTSIQALNQGNYVGIRIDLAPVDWADRLKGRTVDE